MMIYCPLRSVSCIYYLIPFSTFNSVLIWLRDSNSTSVFFKDACHANTGANPWQDQAHIFQYILFESFQIHLRVIRYHFERINHDFHQDFFFNFFSIHFFHAFNHHL